MAKEAAHPNIVLIQIDTLRADHVGCYGFSQPTTPGLDALAAEGVRFAKTLSQCSWTRPSVGSYLTSLEPRTLGLYVEKNEILADDFETLAEVLKGHGYTTVGVTANPNLNRSYNFQQGFDHYRDSNVIFSWMEAGENSKMWGSTPLPTAEELFQETWSIVEGCEGGGPFYLQIVAMEPHEWVLRERAGRMIRREHQKLFRGQPFGAYLQLIHQADAAVAAFVEKVRHQPGWEDTIFVVLSDHGEGLEDHPDVSPSKTHGHHLYESVLWVPWIVVRPGWTPAKAVVDQQVRLLDVAPTVLDMAGWPVPPQMEGVSLWPVLNGTAERADIPEVVMAETNYKGYHKVGAYGDVWKAIENQGRKHKGTAPHELQARGLGKENGAATSQWDEHPEVDDFLMQWMKKWEEAHPKAAPTPQKQATSDAEREQLESIGYLE